MNLKPFDKANLTAKDAVKEAVWVIRTFVSTNRRLSFALLISIIVQAAFPGSLALITRSLVREINAAGCQFSDVRPWILASVAVTVMYCVLGKALNSYVSAILYDKVNIQVVLSIMEHSARLEVSFFENAEFQDFMAKLKQNAGTAVYEVQRSTVSLVIMSIQFVSLLIILIAIEKIILAFVVLLVVPCSLFYLHLAKSRYAISFNQSNKRRWSRYFAALLTRDRSVPEVRVCGLAPLLIDKFKRLMNDLLAENNELRRKKMLGESAYLVFSTILLYMLFSYVLLKMFAGRIPASDAIVFGAIILVLKNSVNELSSLFSSLFEQVLNAHDLRRFLSLVPERSQHSGCKPDTIRGDIRIQNVSFRYPGTDRYVIKDLTLHIPPGERLALVGINAAGKTTLAKLIAGIYLPTEGDIFIDDISLSDWSLSHLQQHISFVFQDYIRFESSAAENIAYGDWQHLLDHQKGIEMVAKKAALEPLIATLPSRYHTKMGRYFGELNLSGGQWQHFALARALAKKNPAIMIFDEFTSNFDSRKEYAVFNALKDASENRTTIIISHRFSTISMADKIVVLSEGAIVETGTHDELTGLGGVYAELYSQHKEQYAHGSG